MVLKMDIEMYYLDVWVVIFVFNEVVVIGKVVIDVWLVFDYVVCVDDGSIDGIGDIVWWFGVYFVCYLINLG